MKKTAITLATAALALLAACDKPYVEEEETKTKTTTTTTNASGEEEIDTTSIDYLTVADVLSSDTIQTCWVKGYIVAACTKSIGNADFEEPFEGSTAILLADNPVNKDNIYFDDDNEYGDNQVAVEGYFYIPKDSLMPVELAKGSVRNDLNLVDNPQMWNKQLLIRGKTTKYMGRQGLKQVKEYYIYR